MPDEIVCKRCGSINDYTIGQGKGPHGASAICNGCDRFIKWLPKKDSLTIKNNTMGLENNNSARYLSIGEGKITKRVKEPTENSVSRVTKEGKTVHEEIYDAISGTITDIKTQDHPQFGRFWNVTLTDGSDTYILQMNYSSSYSAAFLKLLPNVNLSLPVRIIPTMKVVEGKKKPGMFIMQNGEALKHYYTKDNPNGLPPLAKVKVKVQGKLQEKWDDNDMMEFLENMVNETIKPKLGKAPAAKVVAMVDAEDITEADEQLPF